MPVPWPDHPSLVSRMDAVLQCTLQCTFLLQCTLFFDMQPSPLSLTVLVWAKSFWDANGPATHSFTKFCYHFREVFGQAAHSLSVNDQLLGLHQGQSSITEYALKFRTLTAESGWNETALMSAYWHRLHTSILQQMAIYEDVIHLENFIQQSVHNSLRFTECDMDSAAVASAPVTPSLSLPAPRPIQINTVHLCTTEQQWRIDNRLCLYSGNKNHMFPKCPICPPAQQWKFYKEF